MLDTFVSFRSTDELLEYHPSYFAAEALFITVAIILTIDAWYLQKESRFKALWMNSILLGWTTEFLSLHLQELNNFNHARGSVMFFGREPLYMLCVYVFLFYCPIAVTWHMKVDFVGGVVLAALDGSVMFSVVDIVGAAQLWWEWHSDDPLYESRFLHVPAVSAMWVMTQMAGLFVAFHLVDKMIATRKEQNIFIVFTVAVATSVMGGLLLIVLSSLLFWLLVVSFGISALQVVVLWYILMLSFMLYLIYKRELNVGAPILKLNTAVPAACSIAVCLVLIFLTLVTNIDDIRSVGVHQPHGLTHEQCDLRESCFWGMFERSIFICDTSHMPFYVCEPPRDSEQREYTTCGKSDGLSNYFTLGIAYLVLNFLILTLCLKKKDNKPPEKTL